ncbi:MAG: hypothetical protein M3439_07385 [Chloroflexota bacterium]|nr:hypothetical protein [Chloroflexota bacterium]
MEQHLHAGVTAAVSVTAVGVVKEAVPAATATAVKSFVIDARPNRVSGVTGIPAARSAIP